MDFFFLFFFCDIILSVLNPRGLLALLILSNTEFYTMESHAWDKGKWFILSDIFSLNSSLSWQTSWVHLKEVSMSSFGTISTLFYCFNLCINTHSHTSLPHGLFAQNSPCFGGQQSISISSVCPNQFISDCKPWSISCWMNSPGQLKEKWASCWLYPVRDQVISLWFKANYFPPWAKLSLWAEKMKVEFAFSYFKNKQCMSVLGHADLDWTATF